MCIIAYKPENIAFPAKKTLAACFTNNPDGAGFMYAYAHRVHILKGFQTFAAFWSALKAARAVTGDGAAYVLHFRISTQAGTRPDCCHPFPISSNMDDLRALRTTCSIGLAHNGIIHACSDYRPGITYSDTMQFIAQYASLIIRRRTYYKSAAALELLRRLSGSRLAILDGCGHCELIGDGWTADRGVYYSNSSYKPRPVCDFFAPDLPPADDLPIEYEERDITRGGRRYTVYRDGPFIGLLDDHGDPLEEYEADLDGWTLEEAADVLFSPWIY